MLKRLDLQRKSWKWFVSFYLLHKASQPLGVPPDTPLGKGLHWGGLRSSRSQLWPGTTCGLRGEPGLSEEQLSPPHRPVVPPGPWAGIKFTCMWTSKSTACEEAAWTGLGQDAQNNSSHGTPLCHLLNLLQERNSTPSALQWEMEKGQTGTSGKTVLMKFIQ